MASEYTFETRAIPANADSDFVSDKLGSSICQLTGDDGFGAIPNMVLVPVSAGPVLC